MLSFLNKAMNSKPIIQSYWENDPSMHLGRFNDVELYESLRGLNSKSISPGLI